MQPVFCRRLRRAFVENRRAAAATAEVNGGGARIVMTLPYANDNAQAQHHIDAA
jgi:hypothetical protein